MAPDRPTSRLAVVTGASYGIGLEIAERLSRDGHDLVLAARSADRLEEVATRLRGAHGRVVHVVVLDGSEPDAADRLAARLDGIGEVEVLVNNAGFGALGPFAEQDADLVDSMIRLNVSFLVRLTRRCLDGMRARGRGRILNVASTAAFQPGPFMAVYYATKAFVLSFSEALDEELRGSGVTVTTLCPGPTTTEFQARAGMEHTSMFEGPLVMDAKRVANLGVDAMQRGRRLKIAGVLNSLLAFSTRLAPRRLATRIVRRLQQSR